MTDRTPSRTEN